MRTLNFRSRFATLAFVPFATLGLLPGDASAVTQVFDGANGAFNVDSWNQSARWNGGAGPVPSGTDDVVINASKVNWAINSTGLYSGSLTLLSNSVLGIGPTAANNTVNALGTNVNTRTITMHSGSRITMRVGAGYTFNQQIVLLGNATLAMSESTSGHNQTRTFNTSITGPFTLTILGNNGNTVNLNAANSFSNLNMTADDRYRLFLNAAGAAGTGNVTMGRRANADARGGSLVINSAADTIADTATVTLNNIGYDGTTSDGGVARAMVVMNENETIGNLVVNGPAGIPTLRFLSSDSTLKVNGTSTFNGSSAVMQILNTAALTTGAMTFNDNAGWNITGNTVTIDTTGGGTGNITTNVDATIASRLSGSGFTKLGAGKLTLTNSTNNYSGVTDIQAGTLALTATGALGSSSVEIGSAGTLDTTAISFTMLGSQPITWDIDPTGAGSAGLLDASILDITNGMATFNALSTLDDAFYVVANYTSLIGTSFATTVTPTGYILDYNFNGQNQIALVQRANAAVPEPATATLGLLGLSGLMMRRRRMA